MGGFPMQPKLRRRSTDASGGLDYYFSSLAGAGGSSSSSSLALSPSSSLQNMANPSPGGLSTSPSPSVPVPSLDPIKSSPNPGQGQNQGLRVDNTFGYYSNSTSSPIPSPVSVYSSNPSPSTASSHSNTHYAGTAGHPRGLVLPEIGAIGALDIPSPGGWSSTSEYSVSPIEPRSERGDSMDSNAGRLGHSPMSNFLAGGGTATEAPQSVPSRSLNNPQSGIAEENGAHERTPQAQSVARMPNAEYTPFASLAQNQVHQSTPQTASRSSTASPVKQTTPTRPQGSPSAKGYTPSSGRFPFTAPLEIHHAPPTPPDSHPEPQSAPAAKSEFDVDKSNDDGQDTLKDRRNRRTMPPVSRVVIPTDPVERASSPASTATTATSSDLLSPVKYERAGSSTPERVVELSPGRSPEPPPRSRLRPA